MAFLEINPRYQHLLQQQGLMTPADFLNLPSLIICGHPDRNVARVTLGTGAAAIDAFLKREHYVPWKERLLNAIAGFGFLSKSGREAWVLRSLQQAGIGCPDWIAAGEDDQGRAFLLLREVTNTTELRLFLPNHQHSPGKQRRWFASKLGEALAAFHDAGFDHPDLYSKHILVNSDEGTFSFLDCQRSRRQRRVSWRRRCRDLAALAATLADDWTTLRERLVCLRAYLRKIEALSGKRTPNLRCVAASIGRRANRLLRQRRIREMRRLPVPNRTQGVIWQDGEALCLTSEFEAELAGPIPDWLRLGPFPPNPKSWVARTWVDLSQSRQALLLRRRQSHRLGRLWALLRRRPPASPELRRAGLLLRLERYGICTARLLAFGQRCGSCQSVESFLLVEPPSGAVGWSAWLARHSTELGERRRLIHEAAGLLRRLHDLHYYLGGQPAFSVIPIPPSGAAQLVLANIDRFRIRRRPSKREAWRDLAALYREISSAACGRTDGLRLLLGYLGLRKPDAAAKRLARILRPRHESDASAQIVRADASDSCGWGRYVAGTQGALP